MTTFTAAEDWHDSDMEAVVRKGERVTSERIEVLAMQYGIDTFQVVGAIIKVVEKPDGMHYTVYHAVNR